jgi:hypothetical protein
MAEMEDWSDPEKSGQGRSEENDSGSERPGKRFLAGMAEGIGQTLGIALAGLLITGLAAGVVTGTQNGPHQEGGAVTCALQ